MRKGRKKMKKGLIRGMIAGTIVGASAATIYGMMNWEQERRMGRAVMRTGKAISDKANKMFR